MAPILAFSRLSMIWIETAVLNI